MTVLQGHGVSQGAAHGPLYFFRRSASPQEAAHGGCDPEEEGKRLACARDAAAQELLELAGTAEAAAGKSGAALFEAHAMLLEDEDAVATADALIAQGHSAEYAVAQAAKTVSALLSNTGSPELLARAADVQDVADRLQRLLSGAREALLSFPHPVILCAEDLSPSETIRLDKRRILAIATRGGSASSHTAILARTLGIPAVCGLGGALDESLHGREAVLSGDTGQLILDPDQAAMRILEESLARRASHQAKYRSMIGLDDRTLDGRPLPICCNIASPEDVSAVLHNDGRGIGLFRSEFLYLASQDYPQEDVQFHAYRQVAAAMDGKRVVIRTLDIGADKQIDYFHLHPEENPALGMRAVRLCLAQPQMFNTQLRALYRASAYGNLAILLPMITSVWELQACRQACRRAMEELAEQGIPFNPDTQLGVTIETPAAVMMAPELAREADFFSVGTNDLTQYTLACDRQCAGLEPYFNPRHPAVLRQLKLAADAAHQAGIPIGICGELAADPDLLPTFLALGIDELSVAPSSVLPLRAALREINTADCDLRLLAE